MASPVTHLLDRTDYSKHHLVTLPPSSLPTLAPSSLRLQTKILGLTTNNFAYARLGHILGWWALYPLPENTPAPYNDSAAYGRIAAWGYAEITESTVPEIQAGNTVYGFLPISTLPEDIRVEQTGFKDQLYAVDPHRQHVWKIYNRYQLCGPLSALESTKTRDSLGWDALMQGLFATSYNLSTFGFAWDDALRIHPSGEGAWSAADANLDNSTVIILNASGKTGMSFAYALRRNRPKAHQPTTIIGVGSPTSAPLIQDSKLYDKVLLYADAQAARQLVDESRTRRVLLCDFGAREGARAPWRTALESSAIPFTFLFVGGDVRPEHPEDAVKRFAEPDPGRVFVNAGKLRERGIETGGDAFFEAFYKAWEEFKDRGAVPGVTVEWGEGMEGWAKGWEALCKDEVRADRGLVYQF